MTTFSKNLGGMGPLAPPGYAYDFIHAVFVSSLVCQTYDRMIFGRMRFKGTSWNTLSAQDPQMVRHQKNFGNHCCMVSFV